MPTYKYRCRECQHELDVFQSMSDPLLTECPSCHRPSLKRVVSGGLGVIFKGQGFYVNDSKGGSGKPSDRAAATDGVNGSASTASGGGKSDGAVADGDGKPASTETGGAASHNPSATDNSSGDATGNGDSSAVSGNKKRSAGNDSVAATGSGSSSTSDAGGAKR